MHFEILVEDQAGKKMLDCLVPRIIGGDHTFTVHSYKGIGRIPKNLNHDADPTKRILLDRLPKLLAGYGRTFAEYPADYSAAVIIVCDLDDRCLRTFREELLHIEQNCHPRPNVRFCIAIEEGEAWFLGDIPALKIAYPSTRDVIVNNYIQDSICGTWELLADAIYRGGSQALSGLGWQEVGRQKSIWAEQITPNMDINRNQSPSFDYFLTKLRELAP
jgi:Domain of unknown function (DUF4276)